MAENLTSLLRKLYNSDNQSDTYNRCSTESFENKEALNEKLLHILSLLCNDIKSGNNIRSQMDQRHRIFSQKATKLNQNHLNY